MARQMEEWETVGGRLVLAEINRGGISITSHDVPMARPVARTLHEFVVTHRADTCPGSLVRCEAGHALARCDNGRV